MSFRQGVEFGVECQIFVIVTFLTEDKFYNLGHIQGIKGCLNSKEIIFGALHYFKNWFSCQLKKSKQIFNAKLVIQHPVEMTCG